MLNSKVEYRNAEKSPQKFLKTSKRFANSFNNIDKEANL